MQDGNLNAPQSPAPQPAPSHIDNLLNEYRGQKAAEQGRSNYVIRRVLFDLGLHPNGAEVLISALADAGFIIKRMQAA